MNSLETTSLRYRPKRLLVIGTTLGALCLGGALFAYDTARAQVAPVKPAAPAAETISQPAGDATPRAFGAASYADLVARVAPAVVTIRSERVVHQAGSSSPLQIDPFFRQFFGDPGESHRGPREFREGGLGSGTIVSADGYVLTNNHVVDEAQRIKVELADRRVFDAEVVGADPPSDLAVLKIAARDLPHIPLGNSDDVRVGDVVLAFGNPLGVGQTVTQGIISAKGRQTGLSDGSFEDFLQTDAPINRGNSGGPLVAATGELVGINAQIVSPSGGSIGIGFAIPANMARSVMGQLIASGRVRRGQLGVTVQSIDSDLAAGLGIDDTRGALISNVVRDSAGERAGLERGDVIVAVDGRAVTEPNELRNRIAETTPGSTVTLDVVRDGHHRDIKVQLGELQMADARDRSRSNGDDAEKLGVAVRPLSGDDARELGVSAGTRGLVVEDVDPAGAAADAGIRPGDVIEQVNRKPVTSVDELKAALRASSGKPAVLLVNRRGNELFVAVDRNG